MAGDFKYARDLVEFIKKYKAFSVAVAVYPEVHRDSGSVEKDMEYTKQKIDAGADIAITQMFFDNRYFYEFRERAAKIGITIPILPGIMPIVDCRKMVSFAGVCNTTIPPEILDRMEPVLDMPEEMRKLGRRIRDPAVPGPDQERRALHPLLQHEPVGFPAGDHESARTCRTVLTRRLEGRNGRA